VSPEALAAAEKRLAELGYRIPPSYRSLLSVSDGGRPIKSRFTFRQHDRVQADRVKTFLGIGPAPDGDIVETLELVGDIPKGVLPIAIDPFGNFVCLDGRDGRDGPVLFWDHEEELDPPNDSNLYEIAPNLQAFLGSLTERSDVPVAHRQTGWRRLFGRRV
jgi:hypothetical protein